MLLPNTMSTPTTLTATSQPAPTARKIKPPPKIDLSDRPNRSKWLVKTLQRETSIARPKPVINGAPASGHIAQKVSLDAQLATPWDPFARRDLKDQTNKLIGKSEAAKRPNANAYLVAATPTTRFKSWKDETDEKVTWKVFPKSTPRMKHRGGNIVVTNLLKDPDLHPDIEISEHAEDKKCWLVRVEDVDEEVLEGRRKELVQWEKNMRKQRGRGKKVGAVQMKKKRTRKDLEDEGTVEHELVLTRKAAKAAKEEERASKKAHKDMDDELFG
jgi:hypothetical protein